MKAGPNDRVACTDFERLLSAGLKGQRISASDQARLTSELAQAEYPPLRSEGVTLANAEPGKGSAALASAGGAIQRTCTAMGIGP